MTRLVPGNLYLEDGKTGVREFRVSAMDRYKVTDWESFNGAPGKSGVRTIAENLTLAQANAIAFAFGAQHPGSLVNGMVETPEREPQSVSDMVLAFAAHEVVARGLSFLTVTQDAEGNLQFERLDPNYVLVERLNSSSRSESKRGSA